jgi:hypothetical protein
LDSGFAFTGAFESTFASTFGSTFAAGLAGFAAALTGAAGFGGDFLTAAPFEVADFAAPFTGFAFAGTCLAGAFAVFFACVFVVILRSSLDAARSGRECGSNTLQMSAGTVSLVAGRHKKAMSIAPAFLGRLGIETLHGALPFGIEFRHLPQLRCGTEPASLDIFGIPPVSHFVRRANVAGCSPRPEALDELGHA